FRAIGKQLLFDGFLRVWAEAETDADENESLLKIPELATGESVDLLEMLTRQHFTQPPSRYTEAALIKALEERGIGRPSTYAAIMATLKNHDYVLLEKRLLHPTSLGEATCDSLVAAFPQMMDYGFTAQVEDWLDAISRGENEWIQTLHDFYTPFSAALAGAETIMRTTASTSRVANPVAEPTTGASQAKPHGRRRSMSGAPSTKASHRSPKIVEGVMCPVCGSPMVKRKGPRGEFLGCSTYPKCRGTRQIAETEDTSKEQNTN
ncbi:MAG TPA: DNA topoisomerase, partial [Anaerolineae bacterium]